MSAPTETRPPQTLPGWGPNRRRYMTPVERRTWREAMAEAHELLQAGYPLGAAGASRVAIERLVFDCLGEEWQDRRPRRWKKLLGAATNKTAISRSLAKLIDELYSKLSAVMHGELPSSDGRVYFYVKRAQEYCDKVASKEARHGL